MSETFEVNGTQNFSAHANQIEVVVNGQSRGTYPTNGVTVGTFIREKAKYYGLKTFSVYLDNRKLDTTYDSNLIATQFAASAKKLELVAKDSRGDGAETMPEQAAPAPAQGDQGDEQPTQTPAQA